MKRWRNVRNPGYNRRKVKDEEAKVTKLDSTKLEEEVEKEYRNLGLTAPAKTLKVAEETIRDRKNDLDKLDEVNKYPIWDHRYVLAVGKLALEYEGGGNYLSAAILYLKAGMTGYAAANYKETVRILKQYEDYLTAAVILWKELKSYQSAIRLLTDHELYKPALEIAEKEGDTGTVKDLKEKIKESSKKKKKVR